MRHSLSVRTFADRMAVSPSQVYRWESGKTAPTIHQLCRLMEIMGARPERFFVRARVAAAAASSSPPGELA